jgi:uncharacterized protein
MRTGAWACYATPMPIDPELLAMLVCPVTKQELLYISASDGEPACLLSVSARLRYRIEAEVPVLLREEAVALDEAGVERLRLRAQRGAEPSTDVNKT